MLVPIRIQTPSRLAVSATDPPMRPGEDGRAAVCLFEFQSLSIEIDEFREAANFIVRIFQKMEHLFFRQRF